MERVSLPNWYWNAPKETCQGGSVEPESIRVPEAGLEAFGLSDHFAPSGVEVDPETGVVREVGRIGIQRALETRRVGPVGALAEGWRRVVTDGANILGVLRGMFTGRLSPRELGGPIFVAQLSGQFARIGFDVFLSFMAFFSVNLAILNLLPIPVLDGGHLIFLIAEGVRGKPLPASVRLRLSQIGLTLLLGLMLLAVTNDVMRLFE
ncbi:MAG: site-2 protease family protein [Gemmatimonadetes bacterium]|nr:site-2 protease family protein [Gemmatimonadota bacterium]